MVSATLPGLRFPNNVSTLLSSRQYRKVTGNLGSPPDGRLAAKSPH